MKNTIAIITASSALLFGAINPANATTLLARPTPGVLPLIQTYAAKEAALPAMQKTLVRSAARATGAALGASTLTLDAGFSLYQYYTGEYSREELVWQLVAAAGSAAAVGTTTQIAVLCGFSATGLPVLAIGAGTYFVSSFLFEQYIQDALNQDTSPADLLHGWIID